MFCWKKEKGVSIKPTITKLSSLCVCTTNIVAIAIFNKSKNRTAE